jgi:hypothetical protein
MRNFIISLVVIVVLWQVSGLLGSSRQERPGETLARLMTPPARSVHSPIENGYFMLVGMTALTGTNPTQTGYDMWLESNGSQGQREFDFDKPGRSELRIPVAPDELFPEWSSSAPLAAFQSGHAQARISTSLYQTLLARYTQWLQMRFDDWGFAHRGIPRIENLVGAHRLYVIDGFSRQMKVGIERLVNDLARWRMVLRDARTLGMKVTAQVLLEDDLQLLSRVLNEDSLDRALLTRALEHLQPLTPGEYSLRWPMQSEFTLAYVRSQRGEPFLPAEERNVPATSALARTARLYPDDFQHVTFGHNRSVLNLQTSQRTWDEQAAEYAALIRATETAPVPRLIRSQSRHSDHVAVHRAAVPSELDPAWQPFDCD